jgi:hypothetical protein
MKNLKNLTDELLKAEAKDKFYLIEGTIVRLLAPQQFTRPFTYKKKGWGQIERVEATADGTPQDLRAPKRKRKVRKGEEEIKTGDCWTFKVEDDTILLPWGTHFGIFKKSLLRSLEAQRKLRYEAAPLALMRVYPLWLPVGKAPCESMKEGRIPEVILETRHTQSGDVMVEVFFDYIENRNFSCIVEVDSEAPINEEKFVALIKTLNTLDVIGPAKRGQIRIDKVVLVEPTEEELKKLSTGEPVQPVIY